MTLRVPVTTTHRMVVRVHGHTADGRANTQPTCATSFAQVDIALVRIGNTANCCQTIGMNFAQLTAVHFNLRINAVLTHQLGIATCTARQLAAGTRFQFNVVHNRTDWHIFQRHCVTRLNVFTCARDNHITRLQITRGQNIRTHTVSIFNQRNKCSAVWVIFQTNNCRRHTRLFALKVNQTILALMTATLVHNGDMTKIVTPTLGLQTNGQGLFRGAAMQFAAVHLCKTTGTRCYWLIML